MNKCVHVLSSCSYGKAFHWGQCERPHRLCTARLCSRYLDSDRDTLTGAAPARACPGRPGWNAAPVQAQGALRGWPTALRFIFPPLTPWNNSPNFLTYYQFLLAPSFGDLRSLSRRITWSFPFALWSSHTPSLLILTSVKLLSIYFHFLCFSSHIVNHLAVIFHFLSFHFFYKIGATFVIFITISPISAREPDEIYHMNE